MSEQTDSILIVDDEPDILQGLRRILRLDGYNVDMESTASGLLSHTNWSDYFAIILDRKLPDGMADELLPRLKELAPHAAIIIVTGYADMDGALTALRHEAADYLVKPVNPDALRVSLARIAERNATAERLRQSEVRFHLLVDGVQDYAIYMLDPDGNVVSWNDGAKRIKGYVDNEILGKHFSCFYTPQDLQDGKPARELTIATENGRYEEEGWRVRKDRSQFYANVVITPLWDQQHHLIGYAKVTRDITETKRAQAKLMQSERLSAIGEAMAGLVHESRNALNRTQSALRMIERRTKDKPELKQFFDGAREAQRDIQRLFEEVRQYAAPVRINPRPCNLVEVIDKTWERLIPVRDERTARVVHSCGGTCTDCDACDTTLSQVFRNVLENALSACKDPVAIDVQYSNAELNGQPAIRVAFCDNGPGVRPELRDQVFDAFFTTKTHGTGLGMAISKRVVEAHGGTIGLGDQDDHGAKFIITLPIKRSL